MCTSSHFRLRQHLVHKAREYPWCRIILCTEEYTKLDRDINGAHNILLRYLTKK
ncbi:29051_t:CDS:2, partial [Gigaspora margarita]